MSTRRPSLVKKEREQAERNMRRRKEAHKFFSYMCVSRAELDKLPAEFLKMILQARLPKPQVVIDPSAAGLPDAEWLATNLTNYFKQTEIAVSDDSGREEMFDLNLLFSTWVPLNTNLTGSFNLMEKLKHVPPSVKQVLDKITDQTYSATMQVFDGIWQPMFVEFFSLTSTISKFDGRLFWFEVPTREQVQNQNKPMVVTIHSKLNDDKIKVLIDGHQRPAYRVRWGIMRLSEANVDAGMFGGRAGSKMPVYIQSHALHKLDERLPKLYAVAQYYVYFSLRAEEQPISRGDGTWLVPYRMRDVTLGYLVCRVVDFALVIQTFLFITMQGTPEADQLYRRLRLTRYKIESLKLDTLDQFVTTDLFDDPDIAAMMQECGLGDLAKFRSKIMIESIETVAADLKKHLKWRGPKPMAQLEEGDFGL